MALLLLIAMPEQSIEMASGIESNDYKRSGDYAVFDAAQVAGSKSAKGFAFLASAAEQAGRFITVTLDSEGSDVELEKVTSATGRYSTQGAAVRHIYISHDTLEEIGGTSTQNGFDAPESLGLSVSASDEETFEESQETPEEATDEAENLLSDAGSENSVEVDSSEESAEELLDEAEAAA